uniref:Uncharacterized protein n=1 Tax=Xiphophorus couchianus TaxID=32473 RepID=A0A3B5L4B2_9TELE
VAAEQGASPAQSPLVTVTFQRNAKRTEKYLEAEPKVLGVGCVRVIIAGGVAVAAKNLHLPTLDVLLLVSFHVNNFINHAYQNPHIQEFYPLILSTFQSIHSHFFAGGILIQACLLAISATLAAYCCKVINCCGAANKMPVITIQSPADQQREG